MDAEKSLKDKVSQYLATDVWRVSLAETTALWSFLIRQLRVLILTFRGFDQDKCSLRASALTFYSLLSIVPVVAMAFGVAKGFGVEDILRRELLTRFSGQEEILTRVIDFAHGMLATTRGGMVAGAGLAVLFWTVIKVLMQIESSFNDIWEIHRQRSYGQRFSNYLSIMLVSPVVLVVSGSATVFITAQVTRITETVALLGIFAPVIYLGLKFLPYALMWSLLAFVYITVPNTRVNLKSGLLAAVVAGTMYQAVQWAYITFQIGLARYNAIYGSFAALPMFLVWLQLSWLIVLFGAEYAFATQNVDAYEFEPDLKRASRRTRTLLALEITRRIVRGFERGTEPPTAAEISAAVSIPIRLTRQLLSELVDSGVLQETRRRSSRWSAAVTSREAAFLPQRDIGAYTIGYVMERLERSGSDTLNYKRSRELTELEGSLESMSAEIESSPENRLLKDI